MALVPLRLPIRSAASSEGSTVHAVGTTVSGGSERLVGTSMIDDINEVVPGAGKQIAEQGLNGSRFSRLVKENPGKAVAVAVTLGVASDEAYEHLVRTANTDPDAAKREAAAKAQAIIDEMDSRAGVLGTVHEGDDKVAGYKMDEVRNIAHMVNLATERFERACNAVGGKQRLIALMEWDLVDDDLKQLVLDANP